MTAFLCFLANAASVAINVALYANNPSPIGLACIVFSSSLALFFLAMAVTE